MGMEGKCGRLRRTQTFDGDGVAVDGALDDYSANVVYTKALGEGAIEGQAADYELPPNAPFSSVFKYCPPNRCCFCAVHTHPCNTPCDMQAAFFTRSPVYSFLHEQLATRKHRLSNICITHAESLL